MRIALVNQTTGERYTLCDTSKYDRVLNDPGMFAFSASVAPVDLMVLGKPAAAVVAWTEGEDLPEAVVKMRFLDSAGCGLGFTFRPSAGPAIASSVAWSEAQHAVLVTLHDQRDLYRVWVDSQGAGDKAVIATGQSFIYGLPVAAVASDGSALVVWAENRRGALGILLDAAGNPDVGAESTDQDATFAIDLPLITQEADVVFSLSVAAAEQFVVAMEQRTMDRGTPARVMAREYALDGSALGPGYLLDPSDSQEQASLTMQHAPGGTLVAVWESKAARGTVGRVLGAGGAPRFNTVSCDDGRFAIGMRSEVQAGFPSVSVSNGNLLVFHNAVGGNDPRGSASRMWIRSFDEIWPGPQ